jgi:hypothetical protein
MAFARRSRPSSLWRREQRCRPYNALPEEKVGVATEHASCMELLNQSLTGTFHLPKERHLLV